MRQLFVVCTVLFLGAVAAAMKSDTIDIDVTTIKASNERHRREVQDSDDENDDGSSGRVQADEASGSGDERTTETTEPDKSVVTKKTSKGSKKKETKPTKNMPTTSKRFKQTTSEQTTEKVMEVTREATTTASKEDVSTTTSDNLRGGGISNDGDLLARKGADEGVQVLTTEVIAAVVVGGVCAIILIAFLVYRLRKRDEGSYILTDNGFKDTNKLRGDTGKEAFV